MTVGQGWVQRPIVNIYVILYALTKVAEGTECSEAYSQRLQTFQHTNQHTGSLEMREHLKLRLDDSRQRQGQKFR